jgi:rubrerythrin
MDIFDFALKMELDGEQFYRNLAEKVQYEDLQAVLNGLADDERRHYQIIEQAKNQTMENIDQAPFIETVQNVFAGRSETFWQSVDVTAKLKHEQIDVYRAALIKEQESVALYQKMKATAEKPVDQAICEKLMHEEAKHVEILEDIIDMLNHVHDWVEAAEFNHKKLY